MKRAKRGLDDDLDEEVEDKLKSVPKEARTLLAKLCDAFVEDNGKVEKFLTLCEKAGYRVAGATLRRWRHNVHESGEALPGGDARGRPRALTAEQERLLVGFVFWKNVNNEIVQLSTCITFLEESFGITMVESTVHDYLTSHGFSSRKMKKKTTGYVLSQDALADMAFSWLNKEWRLLQRGEIWSIDITLTGHRLDTFRSYSPAGGPPPLLGNAISRFTNAIVTAISSLGRMYYSMLFTLNPAFRRDRKSTARRDAQVEKLDQVLTKYNVAPRRIVYVGKPKNETRTYVSASVDIVQMFLEANKIEAGSTWLSDNGNEFFPETGSSLAYKDVNHFAYPAAVHQYLSPNDNNHHSSAKQKWRSMKLDFEDDVTASVALLWCLDMDQPNIRGYFETNLQLGKSRPDLEEVRSLVGGDKLRSNSYYKECMYEYCIAFKKDGRGVRDGVFSDDLDGRHWHY